MAISKMSNGFYTFSDSYLKSMRKQDLINYIRTIEKNWQNSLITNCIQYENCKRLLAEERNKAIDEFVEKIYDFLSLEDISYYREDIKKIAEQMKAGGIDG